MNKCILLIAVLIVSLAFTAGAVAANKVVEVEGNSVLSREDAIRQAQRSAVEQAVGVFIHSKTETENFVLKKDKIMARTQGYITRFNVLKEGKTGDLYRVMITAVVSLDKIKNDLFAMKILLDSMDRPNVMILIEEEYIGMDNIGARFAETELYSLLAAKGFDLVDKAQMEKIRVLAQTRQALAGNMTAAKSLGLHSGVQYLILGKAVVQDIGEAYPGSGMRSLQASLQVRVIQIQTGLVLGSVVKNGVVPHISQLTGATRALQISARKAVNEYLVDTITNSFQEYLNNGAPVKLHITGVTTFQQYNLITSTIETLDRVVTSKKEGWSKAGGLLELDLRFKGTSEELAQLLDGLSLGSNHLSVVHLTPDRVDCTFQ
ncbi:MAG: hypothetical protein D4R45_07760 [Planctomycetaceae bacterium]|nr:MAG: hypothetical protein D4R45_07760 [Planctomycetaceae bacterium]